MKFILPILLLLVISCPDPPEETFCGQGMILQADTCACIPNSHPIDDGESCECDSLYHWNDDLTECILDTTTYDITWEFDTLGIYFSIINDVAIIDQNNIWAVGWITFPDPDSSWDGDGTETFNAAHWNGDQWEFLHLDAMSAIGISSHAEIYAVFSLDDNNLWMFTNGGSYIHYDGADWTTEDVSARVGSINAIWGNEPNNVYFVGSNGTITHYDGNSFTLIESDTEISFEDVRGSADGEYVITVGLGRDTTKALQLIDNEIVVLFNYDYSERNEWRSLKAVDIWNHTAYIATFNGLLAYDFTTGDTSFVSLNDLFNDDLYIWKIEANAPNDIFIAEDGGRLLHYNGKNWTLDPAVRFAFSYNGFGVNTKGLDYKDNMIVYAGSAFGGEHAFIARGYRP